MYCSNCLLQGLCKSSKFSQFMRHLRILWSRSMLIKTDQPNVYRLEVSGLRRVLARRPGGHVDPGPLDAQGRREGLVHRVYRALPRILNIDITTRMPPVPPEKTRGMNVLDRNAFKTLVDIPTVLVPVKHIGNFQKKVNKHLFKMPQIKPVAELSEDIPDRDLYRLFLFDPDKFQTKEKLYETLGEALDECRVDVATWQTAHVEVTYSNWRYDDVLRAVLPAGSDGVGGFSVIGHILHLNLKDDLLPYKAIIGEVLLDKVKAAQTVVNKTNTIDNTFRNFSMEVLAGKNDFITTAKENGHSFKMDFSKVYWNPRLSTEHQRIVARLQRGDVLYDVFAGVGPFAVPAAKKRCHVVANDLNPQSFKWLQTNMADNKVKLEPQLHNLDGRDFIRSVVKADLVKRWLDDDFRESMHIVMNLPGLALNLLDVFVGLLGDEDPAQFPDGVLPRVYCYTFSKAEDLEADVRARVEHVMGSALPTDHVIRVVRNVAPNKEMACIEFKLQREVLFAQTTQHDSTENTQMEPPGKKSKLES